MNRFHFPRFAVMFVVTLSTPCLLTANSPIHRRPQVFGREEAEQRLAQVLTREVDRREAADIVQRVGDLKWHEFAPLLKEVAGSCASDPKYEMVAFDALHALHAVGEPREYFIDCARAHVRNKILAYYAMSVLARTPDDEILKLMEQVGAESRDSHIQSQAGQAFYVSSNIDAYLKLPTFEQKVDFLLTHAGRGSNCMTDNAPFDRHDPVSSLSPIAVWCRNELTRVATEEPGAVAIRLAQTDAGRLLGLSGFPRAELDMASQKFQDYIVESLPESAQRAYRKLTRNRPPRIRLEQRGSPQGDEGGATTKPGG